MNKWVAIVATLVAVCIGIYTLGDSRFVEEIPSSDTISVYMNATGTFEIPIEALKRQQTVYVYLKVNCGNVNMTLLDRNGESVKEKSAFASYVEYRIDAEGDYLLSLDAVDADYYISVSILNMPVK